MANIAQLLAAARRDPFTASDFAADPSAYLAVHGFSGLSEDDVAVVARVSLDELPAVAAQALAQDLGWAGEPAGSFAESLWAGAAVGSFGGPAVPSEPLDAVDAVDAAELDLAFGSGRQADSLAPAPPPATADTAANADKAIDTTDPTDLNDPARANDDAANDDAADDDAANDDDDAVASIEAGLTDRWGALHDQVADGDAGLHDGADRDDFDDV